MLMNLDEKLVQDKVSEDNQIKKYDSNINETKVTKPTTTKHEL